MRDSSHRLGLVDADVRPDTRTLGMEVALVDGAGSAQALLLRGYGPLVATIVAFAAMALLVPTVPAAAPEGLPAADAAARGPDGEPGQTDTSPEPGSEPTDAEGDPPSAADAAPAVTADDEQATDAAERSTSQAGGTAQQATADAESPGEGARACADRDLQIPGDPYSPPCVAFEGTNPGATHRGVSENEIVIAARTPDEPGFIDELANLANADISDSQQDVRRTISALEEYFNERFEFYGRELRFEFFDGAGSFQEEAQNRGHEQARRDALTVADEIGAFAELTGSTEPYASALAQEGVISVSGIHFPRAYHDQHRPLKWSTFTDCSTVVEAAAEWTVQRLFGRPAAHAGDPQLRDRERDVVALGPENPIYQQCVDDAERVYAEHGHERPDLINYAMDIPTMSNQAANIIAQLQEREATTVQAFVDPVMAIFLTARASEQDYFPEWIISGAAYMDQDVLGQLQHQPQWANAFGISFAGQSQPHQASLGYHAYRQVRDDEPAFAVDVIYEAMYLLAIGIQGAGPELTPETFEQGMFDYPGGTGPYGTWHFGPSNYTATQDFREIYWDPEAVSPFNSEPGSWVETDQGVRLHRGEIPDGPPRLP
jgi:hypothetical protein